MQDSNAIIDELAQFLHEAYHASADEQDCAACKSTAEMVFELTDVRLASLLSAYSQFLERQHADELPYLA